MKRARKRHILEERYLDFYSVAVAMLRDDDDAKDAVQEAMVRTLVQKGVDDPCRYCMQSVKHISVDILRRNKRVLSLEGISLVAGLEEDELKALVREKKASLSRVERAILELHYEDGYPIADVAAITRMSPSNLKRVMASAREKMKQGIEKEL